MIREATAADAPTIKRMIREAQLDPTSLKWKNFLIAEVDGDIAGIGQVKPLLGCRELGSLVVAKAHRKQGIAASLIHALEARHGYPLYLLCLAKLEAFYNQFGYRTIRWRDAPTALKIKLTPALLARPFGIRVLVMVKLA